MIIVVDEAIPFIRGVFENVAQVVYLEGSAIDKLAVFDADALIIRTRTKCNTELLSGSKVKVICSATIGYDHIDVDACEILGIKWFTVPGCNANSVAQYFLSALAELHLKKDLLFKDLTVGVVGYGNVGKLIVRYCNLLGIRVLINDPPLQVSDKTTDFTSLEELVKQSDIISFHTPLVRSGKYSTYQFVNAISLKNVKPDVVLINTSRGEIFNEEELVALKKSGNIGEIVMDVWDGEPQMNSYLLENSFLSTNHIAGYSADGKYNGTVGCVQHICREFNLSDLSHLVSPPLPPTNEIIRVDCSNRSLENVFAEVVLRTYNIENESCFLKMHPMEFESLRNSYPNRREFGAFTLTLSNASAEFKNVFSNLGFTNN